MKSIAYITIFLLCIVIYIHIYYHLKVSDDENIFEIDYTDKVNLEEVCDLRQPFTMKIENKLNFNVHDLKDKFKNILNIVQKKEIKIQEEKKQEDNNETNEKAKTTEIKIYSEQNKGLLADKEIADSIRSFEQIIIPDFTTQNCHDIVISDGKFSLPFTSNFNHRNYLYFSEGSAIIHFISHKYTDKVNHHLDYELMQKVSDGTLHEIKASKDITIKSITVNAGEFVYIPPRWWYSIEFKSKSVVAKFQYKTAMNILAHIPLYIYSYITVAKAQEKKRFSKFKKKKEN